MTTEVTQEAITQCPKCSGNVDIECIGQEYDMFCRNCGWRAAAVARIERPAQMAIAEKGIRYLGDQRWQDDIKVCPQCHEHFDARVNQVYCHVSCRANAEANRRANRHA